MEYVAQCTLCTYFSGGSLLFFGFENYFYVSMFVICLFMQCTSAFVFIDLVTGFDSLMLGFHHVNMLPN